MAKLHSNVTKEIEKQINVKNCWFDDRDGLFHCITSDDTEWTSLTGSAQDEWVRIPKTSASVELSDENKYNPCQEAPAPISKSQESIAEIVDATKDLLLYKNRLYGDSALNPIGIFTEHIKTVPANTASILVRLDDKLGRVKNAPALRINNV